MRIALITMVLLMLSAFSPKPVNAYGCGIVPIKPIPPIGCRDLRPECQCDSNNNCRWVWVCIPN